MEQTTSTQTAPLALTLAPWCHVCEEPVPAVTRSRYHGADVMLCADCLIGELEIVAELEAGRVEV